MEKTITNKTDSVKFSQKVIRDVLETQTILKELNTIEGLEDKASREEYLVNELNLMWDGKKYNNPPGS